MPLIAGQDLKNLASEIYQAVGTSEIEARHVADFQVGANLNGHDSHGVILLPGYVRSIQRGAIKPGSSIEIVKETQATAVVDGHWGFGQTLAKQAMELAIAKAKQSAVSSVTLFHTNHVARLADYTLMASSQGMIGMMTVNGGGLSAQVVPYGGVVGRLGTNPLSIAIPSDLEAPIFLDMATSVVANGKVFVQKNRGLSAPDGWLIDSEGNPTNDVGAFFSTPKRANLLPAGGVAGHKGYGLAFMVDILSGALSGAGVSRENAERFDNGSFFVVLNVEAFRPLEEFKSEVHQLVRYMKATPTAPGITEVLYPGEKEFKERQKREREGIPIEEVTWKSILDIVKELRLEDKVPTVD
ncbi:MAG: Ldh family oxidoreductase [Candidatus Tectomicrobia bacterium]|nr:Ldh family oxidoreductase [Candidatus Tectomicrobia bacterium]